jgi:anti-anti-sigma factor
MESAASVIGCAQRRVESRRLVYFLVRGRRILFMAAKSAPVTVTKVEGGFKLKIAGNVSADLAGILEEINRVVEEKPKRVFIDLTACEFISSAGMGALVSLYSKVRANGGSVKITAIREMVFGSFKISRLDQLFGISPEAIIPS